MGIGMFWVVVFFEVGFLLGDGDLNVVFLLGDGDLNVFF